MPSCTLRSILQHTISAFMSTHIALLPCTSMASLVTHSIKRAIALPRYLLKDSMPAPLKSTQHNAAPLAFHGCITFDMSLTQKVAEVSATAHIECKVVDTQQ